ncbi:MAG: choice-of-anchor B family protein [Saprospiraceae bacterium]|nr:choice-of-anchor B family protein [Saprospiraceae bacterium]
MNKLILFVFAFFSALAMSAQSSHNMTLLSKWDDNSLPVASPGGLNVQYSGCWGMAINGREYAVVGGAAHLLFFDITNPATPEMVGKFEGTFTTVWREIKSYKDRIYAVSDNTSEGLMIFDMSQAPDTIIRTYWSNEYFHKAHTITVDTVSGRLYLNGGSAADGIIVLDVSQNPDVPVFLGHPNIMGGYVHDSYVRGDTLYCSSGYDGLYMFDFKNPQNPVFISSVSTGGYNHNVWLNKEGTYAYYTEEVPRGLPIHIVDLQQLALGEDIEVVGNFLDNMLFPNATTKEATPHNVYIRDNLMFNSQYEDGLLVYDISIPTQPELVAWYDTHPENTIYNGYFGNWGSYPWLPSGNVIACDMQNGLHVLDLSPTVGTQAPERILATVTPNPAKDYLRIAVPEDVAAQGWSLNVFNLSGQQVASLNQLNQMQQRVSVEHLPTGMYFLHIRSQDGRMFTQKIAVE